MAVGLSRKCTPLWREARAQVKMYKQHRRSGALLEVEMLKSARRCGAKHMSKPNRAKPLSFGTLLEVQMSKKCAPLWREAHFEVKMPKATHVRAT